MKTLLPLLSLVLGCVGLHADEVTPVARKKVIDVGNLEIKGEIRKPFIQYLDNDRSAMAALPVVAGNALRDYEESLLKPALPPATGAKKQKGNTNANP